MWWQTSIIPATQEAEAGESLKPRSQRLRWAKSPPLHSSLGNRARLHLKNKKPEDKKSSWWRKGEELQNNSGPKLFQRFANWVPKKRSDMSRIGVIVTQSRLESKSSLTLKLVNVSSIIQIDSLWENEIFGFLQSRKHSFFWHFWGANCPHFSFHVAQVGQLQSLQPSGYAHDHPG